ncbi:hypothetical protein A3K64_04065 [Candidatus Micrarchaeota archaeon RBG_16_36_9]|nr:MAG: hypothetical protein A3K64_04065 [Candidatus Micrarchaeota archaeon RBG_16_36_9]
MGITDILFGKKKDFEAVCEACGRRDSVAFCDGCGNWICKDCCSEFSSDNKMVTLCPNCWKKRNKLKFDKQIVRCHHCNYKWTARGNRFPATCPSCHGQIYKEYSRK